MLQIIGMVTKMTTNQILLRKCYVALCKAENIIIYIDGKRVDTYQIMNEIEDHMGLDYHSIITGEMK